MADVTKSGELQSPPPAVPDFDRNLERLDQDLDIMQRHSAELDQAEMEIQKSLKKWDREYKDTRLHSIPRPRKHIGV